MESRIKLDTALDLKGNFLFGKSLLSENKRRAAVFFFLFVRKKKKKKKKNDKNPLFPYKKTSSAAVSPCCIGCARALKTTNLLPRLGAASACVALALALVPWGLGASLRQLDRASGGAAAGSRVMAAALCLALWCAAQCAAALAHAVGAAITFAESYECCRFGAEAGGGSTTTFAVGRRLQQQQQREREREREREQREREQRERERALAARSKLSSALLSLAAGPKWRGAIGGGGAGGGRGAEEEEEAGGREKSAKESREVGTQTGGGAAESREVGTQAGGAVFSMAASSSTTS